MWMSFRITPPYICNFSNSRTISNSKGNFYSPLDKVLLWTDDDFLAVLHNIHSMRQVWGRIRKLLSWEGADPISSEKFYLAVLQAVILFGSEIWVLLAVMLNKLEGV